MARFPITISAAAAAVMIAATPLASAQFDPNAVPAEPENAAPHAMQVNMLPMNMCGTREQVVDELAQIFNEAPMAVGQVDNNAVVEIFVSDSGTWTILATGTDGMSCIVSAGEGFESTTLVRGVDA